MDRERRRHFHFIFQNIRRLIGVFLAAFIAADPKWFIDPRSRHYRVRLPQWNPVRAKEIAPPVKPVVLTYNHPAIIAVYPHFLRRLYFLFLDDRHRRCGSLHGSGVETIRNLSRRPAQPGISTQTVLRDVEEGLRNRGWNGRIGLTLRGRNWSLLRKYFD